MAIVYTVDGAIPKPEAVSAGKRRLILAVGTSEENPSLPIGKATEVHRPPKAKPWLPRAWIDRMLHWMGPSAIIAGTGPHVCQNLWWTSRESGGGSCQSKAWRLDHRSRPGKSVQNGFEKQKTTGQRPSKPNDKLNEGIWLMNACVF